MRPEHGETLRAWLHRRRLSRRCSAVLPQLSRYTLVSALALILDFTVYLLLAAGGMTGALAGAHRLRLRSRPALSCCRCATCSMPRPRTRRQSRLLAEFALSGFAGMAITALVIAVTVDLGGMPLLPAKILAVGVSFLVVFACGARRIRGRRCLPARSG